MRSRGTPDHAANLSAVWRLTASTAFIRAIGCKVTRLRPIRWPMATRSTSSPADIAEATMSAITASERCANSSSANCYRLPNPAMISLIFSNCSPRLHERKAYNASSMPLIKHWMELPMKWRIKLPYLLKISKQSMFVTS